MTDTADRPTASIALAIYTQGEWLIEKVVATEDNPSAVVTVAINPDAPNSYAEWEAVSSVFTEEFMRIASDAMQTFIRDALSQVSEDERQGITEALREGMAMQGFSEEVVATLDVDASPEKEGA